MRASVDAAVARLETSPAEAPAQPELMTVAECAAYLRVHPKTLPELIRRHGLPCALVGRRRRFRRADIDRWLASRKEGP